MIRTDKLNKYYNQNKQNELHVLDNVELELPEHGMCAIFGPSGCGKTTLLNILGGLDNATSGEVRYDDTSIAQDTDRIRNRDIGFIFQNYNLNKLETVFENVADSLRLCGITDEAVIRERVLAALANVGMEKYYKRLPDTLSGGQQQRVAIARAIVKNPRVILADEPTGNLDEANTILVMDILKTMSREHLVVLVTHEEKLVDYYCDTVYELSDGEIVGVRTNENTNGYVERNRNDIFLGELEKTECGNDSAQVDFYGEIPEKPIHITVVNHNGRLFLRVDTEKVAVLDAGSEVKLRNGVFEAERKSEEQAALVDMSKLPSVEGSDYGRLFRLRDSIKSGFRANFRNISDSKKRSVLVTCLFLFGAMLVIFAAKFGVSFVQIRQIREQLNDRTFYVEGTGKDISDRIAEAKADPAAAVDYVDVGSVMDNPFVNYALFETLGMSDDGYALPYSDITQTVVLPEALSKGLKVVCGKGEIADTNDAIITTQVADRLLKNSAYGFIKDYKDLLGIRLDYAFRYGILLRIVGIVDSDENAIYVNEDGLIEKSSSVRYVIPDSNDYFHLQRGECAVLILMVHEPDGDQSFNYDVGDTAMFSGVSIRVKEILDIHVPEKERGADEYKEEMDPAEIERRNKIGDAVAEAFPRICGTYEYTGERYWNTERYIVVNAEDFKEGSTRIAQTSVWITQANTRSASAYDTEKKDVTELPWQSDRDVRKYYRLHSTDPDKTLEYLKAHFSDINVKRGNGVEVASGVITPNDLFNELFKDIKDQMVLQLIVLGLFLAFTCVCMYLVMRASVMNRIREIGIYRAIGTSKKNVIFRFAVESCVVVLMSAGIGFLLMSIFVTWISNKASSYVMMFGYPLWMAISLFAFLLISGVVCGVLPVITLLRKTPSDILAKYDI